MFNAANVPVQPIVSLTPFMGGKPWIKARVVDKGDIRTWNKPGSTGKLFGCTLVDESASIRMTFFNEGADQFFSVINNGSVYYISGFSTKNANRKFNNVANDYELSADRDAQVHLARDAATNIPTQRYNFVPIHVLAHKEKGSAVDLLAIVTNTTEPSKILQKSTGNSLTKRTVTVADATASVELTIWNEEAERFAFPVGTVLAMKNLRVGTFDGVSLSSGRDSTFDPSISTMPDAIKLRQWFEATGGSTVTKLTTGRKMEDNGNFRNLGRRFLSAVETERLGRTPDKTDVFECVIVPTFVRTENVWYDACPTCNKKVTPMADGAQFRCEKCDQIVAAQPRYLCSIQASDNVSVNWLTLFNEAGETFWGLPAAQLRHNQSLDPTFMTRRAGERLHVPILASIRVKEDRMPQGDGAAGSDLPQDRVRLTVGKITEIMSKPTSTGIPAVVVPADRLPNESKFLLDVIKSYGQ